MITTELSWETPADGVWWLPLEHLPAPVSGLFAAAFPTVTRGWSTGAARYGLPTGAARWAPVNGWLYFSPGDAEYSTLDELESAAARALATRAWREEVSRWFDHERPRVIEANLALQAVDLGAVDDETLAAHFAQAVAHFDAVAPLHFEHVGFDVAFGLLVVAGREWGIDGPDLIALLAGSSPATSAAREYLDRIVTALRDAGAATPATLDDVRDASPEVASALDDYLTVYGWRSLQDNEVASQTLGERPDVVMAAIRARMATPTRVPAAPPADTVRVTVPEADRTRFNELLADARLCYPLRDDDGGVCYTWPLGLVRRAALEVGRRLEQQGRVATADHVFQATPAEIAALLAGSGPTADELAERAALVSEAATADPPLQLGEWQPSEAPPLPPNVATVVAAREAAWAVGGQAPRQERLRGTGVGGGTYRGRACVVSTPETMSALEPGDVLIARTTMSTHNSIFPIAGAVAVEEGGLYSHTAVLARELGVPAVVGVSGLLAHVTHGDTVEVDATVGVVRVIDP